MRITAQSRRYASLNYTDNSRNLVPFLFAPRRLTPLLLLLTSSLSRISIISLHNSRSIALSSANKPRTVYLSTNPGMLCTHLLPLQAQDNEELVRLQVDADTGNLRLLDMLLDLELFLCLAIDRWTACVTH